MNAIREPGTLDMDTITYLRDKLLAESTMFREASKLGLVGLMSHLMLKELDREVETRQWLPVETTSE